MSSEKTLVYTTFSPRNTEYEELIWEWLISLRHLAGYEGKAVVFNYGMSPKLIKNIESFDVDVVDLPLRDEHTISNYRNIDVIPHLETYDDDYVIAHYDADIWFQTSLTPMFNKARDSEGVLFATEYNRSCRYRGPKEGQKSNDETQSKIGGFIFGGWQAARKKPYLEKLRVMRDLFNSTWSLDEWGSDQSMLNSILDFDCDVFDGLPYACTHYFCSVKDGRVCKDDTPVTAVHLNGFNKMGQDSQTEIETFRFKHLHRDLWKNYHTSA